MSCRWFNVCPLRAFERQGKLSLRWKKEYCENNFEQCQRYNMEMENRAHPDNMLPDGKIAEELI